MAEIKITALDGPPGSGKTTKLVRECVDWLQPWAIVTYSKDAAETLAHRGVDPANANTIYKLSWPHVKASAALPAVRSVNRLATYRKRAVVNYGDVALQHYEDDAPSRKKRNLRAEQLHSWEPSEGDPPSWIWDSKISPGESYAVALARWLARDAPLADFDGYKFIAVDEAQDLSNLELAAVLALVQDGGEVLLVGDPGQAIYLGTKGWPSDKKLPPAWELAESFETLEQGFRIGYPAADAAAGILHPCWPRSADTFRAEHLTYLNPWNLDPPETGLVLGMSRSSIANYIRNYDLRGVATVPGLNHRGLTVCTIHAAKGYETDDVYLLPWSQPRLMNLDCAVPDALRLLYVALTRGRRNINLPVEILARAEYAKSIS